MTTKPEPYTIFNDAFSTGSRAGQPTTFWPFPRLPVELRTKIWAEYIPARRFIHVSIDDDMVEKFLELYTTKNELGNIISGCPNHMQAAGLEEWSPNTLIKVNHGQWCISPYFLGANLYSSQRRQWCVKSLYISPENDTIWATCHENSRPSSLLVSFLHDLVATIQKVSASSTFAWAAQT